jgi:hypothetical protein
MTGIGYVTDIPHFISQVHKVAVDHIKSYVRPGMTQMAFATDCWPAHVHAHMARYKRNEFFFISDIGIINS